MITANITYTMSANPLNATFDAILERKSLEILQLLENTKNKKNDASPSSSDTINYSVKTTLYKINAETDKKIKQSKTFKKKEQLFAD